MDTQRCCDVESTSLTLIQRRKNVVRAVGTLWGHILTHGTNILIHVLFELFDEPSLC